jgi:hypothetical protein
MTERDAAWMARIIARFDLASIEAVVALGRAPAPFARELVRVMIGRREKILHRYLTRLSPLADPTLVAEAGRSWLCASDLGLRAGVARAPRRYAARAWRGSAPRAANAAALEPLPLRWRTATEVCVQLPSSSAERLSSPTYLEVEVATSSGDEPGPIRFHLYDQGAGHYLLAGVERLDPVASAAPH